MSVEALAMVLHHSKATGMAKVVLLGIANHDGDGGAWPSMRTLAKYANANLRNTRAAVERLERLGEVRRLLQQGGTRDWPDELRPNLYEVLVRCPADCDGTKQHNTRQSRLALAPPVASDPPGPQRPAPPVASDPTPPVASDRQTVQTNHPRNTAVQTSPQEAASVFAASPAQVQARAAEARAALAARKRA